MPEVSQVSGHGCPHAASSRWVRCRRSGLCRILAYLQTCLVLGLAVLVFRGDRVKDRTARARARERGAASACRPSTVPDPRSRIELHCLVRRRLPGRRHQDPAHDRPGSADERDLRAPRRHPAPVSTTAAAAAPASSSAPHGAWHSWVSSALALPCRMASTATPSFVMDSITGGLRCGHGISSRLRISAGSLRRSRQAGTRVTVVPG